MIKRIAATVIMLLCIPRANAQDKPNTADSNAIKIILAKGLSLPPTSDSSETLFLQALLAAEKIGFIRGIQEANDGLASNYYQRGKLSQSLHYLLKNEESAIRYGDSTLLFSMLRVQATIYGKIGDVNMLRKTLMRRQYIIDHNGIKNLTDTSYAVLSQYNSLAQYYAAKQVAKPDSVEYYYRKMSRLGKGTFRENLWTQLSNGGLGTYYLNNRKMYDSAIYHLRIALKESIKGKRLDNQYGFTVSLANAFRQTGNLDSAFFYAYDAFNGSTKNSFLSILAAASGQLAKAYTEKKQFDSAVKYITLERDYKDTVAGMETLNNIQFLTNDYQLKSLEQQREKEAAVSEYKATLKNYFFAGGVLLLLGIIAVMYRINKQRARSKQQVETAYQDLKDTQAQLVQSEKMASLGELTAGIAHEIQNPLNFVNNFSEVNQELLGELVEQVEQGNTQEVKEIAKDILSNEEKIHQHGKRADAIVKGMLQHSRSTPGQKEATDINALCDEYLRLSYHGLRAKDKSFNASTKTDFDPAANKVNIVPQDIGRVLLNLLNNAFYAVNSLSAAREGTTYQPTVSLSTKRNGDNVMITIEDNGTGIPQNIIDKIFQPFFTTKPTGSGTGLGLSLSYDIIKAHGGILKVEAAEKEFTRFIITLPI